MLQNIVTILTSPSTINFAGLKFDGPAILIIPAFIAVIFLTIGSIIWIYRDATQRGKNGVIAVIFILLSGWPLSFVWWLWLRPTLSHNQSIHAEQGAAANP